MPTTAVSLDVPHETDPAELEPVIVEAFRNVLGEDVTAYPFSHAVYHISGSKRDIMSFRVNSGREFTEAEKSSVQEHLDNKEIMSWHYTPSMNL